MHCCIRRNSSSHSSYEFAECGCLYLCNKGKIVMPLNIKVQDSENATQCNRAMVGPPALINLLFSIAGQWLGPRINIRFSIKGQDLIF